MANINGTAGNDRLRGTKNGDQIVGKDGDDDIAGNAGNDKLLGGGGNDKITGDAGNDELDGGAGTDNLDGGDGNDTLFGAEGNDTLIGGAGTDTARFSGSALEYSVTGTSIITVVDNNLANGDDGTDTLTSVENFIFAGATAPLSYVPPAQSTGSAGADLYTGSSAADSFDGGAGDDIISTGDGADVISGGPGNDTISAGPGSDTIRFIVGEGADTIDGGSDVDSAVITGSAFSNTLTLSSNSGQHLINVTGGGTITNVEEIVINLANSGTTNVVVDGDFSQTGLAQNTIEVFGGDGNESFDLSGKLLMNM
jgi:Ca2+-binding RTX toxin-like protein